MASLHVTVANPGRTPAEPSPAKLDDVRCPPMAHQNSGSHGHEMYPQQFVRLIGCHDVPAPSLRKRQDEKLH
ncbi:hypothetical protein ACFQZO_21945 [Bradyrhizobium sp. GCM10027634]|uniref:hypothetical protein n=1 Tax=unclassified Bradyrhizobium TaxID=2631580 RepID=UPI00188BE506|nr:MULTISPECIES: hypothetical protein [unclassified Bradyrhizobium]MDN5003498.1 hypothetical protein [Bradyrhizobium sp. WYCCWR 12677]